MNSAWFKVEGVPVGKERARVFQTKRGNIRAVTPGKTRDYENAIRTAWNIERSTSQPFRGAVRMDLDIFLPVPKGVSKAVREKMLSHEIRPTVKPDSSNVLKAVEDALNKVAYDDDVQVVESEARKWYGEAPRVEVSLSELPADGWGKHRRNGSHG